jgi:hypothetical protein
MLEGDREGAKADPVNLRTARQCLFCYSKAVPVQPVTHLRAVSTTALQPKCIQWMVA